MSRQKDIYEQLNNKIIQEHRIEGVLLKDVEYQGSYYAAGLKITLIRKYNGLEVLTDSCPICGGRYKIKVNPEDVKLYGIYSLLKK